MIRRDDPPDWLLIWQTDHARLAGEIAAVWGGGGTSGLPLRDELVSAVRRHDDGWQAWEAAPQIDPANGVPRSFTEMPMAVATRIWADSIFACAEEGPWGGLWVSRHFDWLAQRAQESRSDDPQELAAIAPFLAEQAQQRQAWKTEAARTADRAELDRLIELGFRYVQFFDRFSLWLCCAARSQPYELDLPAGGRIELIPESQETIRIAPFPLSISPLTLSVPAHRLPARPFTTDAEFQLQLAQAGVETLKWQLTAR